MRGMKKDVKEILIRGKENITIKLKRCILMELPRVQR